MFTFGALGQLCSWKVGLSYLSTDRVSPTYKHSNRLTAEILETWSMMLCKVRKGIALHIGGLDLGEVPSTAIRTAVVTFCDPVVSKKMDFAVRGEMNLGKWLGALEGYQLGLVELNSGAGASSR